jgi:hypothetical protein
MVTPRWKTPNWVDLTPLGIQENKLENQPVNLVPQAIWHQCVMLPRFLLPSSLLSNLFCISFYLRRSTDEGTTGYISNSAYDSLVSQSLSIIQYNFCKGVHRARVEEVGVRVIQACELSFHSAERMQRQKQINRLIRTSIMPFFWTGALGLPVPGSPISVLVVSLGHFFTILWCIQLISKRCELSEAHHEALSIFLQLLFRALLLPNFKKHLISCP